MRQESGAGETELSAFLFQSDCSETKAGGKDGVSKKLGRR